VVRNKNVYDDLLISKRKLYIIIIYNIFINKHLMNWNILVISGKNTNKYFVCTGEG